MLILAYVTRLYPFILSNSSVKNAISSIDAFAHRSNEQLCVTYQWRSMNNKWCLVLQVSLSAVSLLRCDVMQIEARLYRNRRVIQDRCRDVMNHGQFIGAIV